MNAQAKDSVIVSGMRPTGRLHLGHYLGVLRQWETLQEDNTCFFFVADWHALTTDYEDPGQIAKHSIEVVRDWIAAGIDPEKAHLFLQSQVKAHAELHLLLSMTVPVSWLERVPSYKDLIAQLSEKNIATYGFLGYPLLQAADIMLYKADAVPVGEDQVAHLELTREVVRRFHHVTGKSFFVEPKPLLTKAPKVPGIDGRKMSKSYDNAIYLADDAKAVQKKVSRMVTDPARIRKDDPGNPDVCDVYTLHQTVTDAETVADINTQCRKAEIGCVACKQKLAEGVNEMLEPMRARREEATDAQILEYLQQGGAHAQRMAGRTLEKARRALGVSTDKLGLDG